MFNHLFRRVVATIRRMARPSLRDKAFSHFSDPSSSSRFPYGVARPTRDIGKLRLLQLNYIDIDANATMLNHGRPSLKYFFEQNERHFQSYYRSTAGWCPCGTIT